MHQQVRTSGLPVWVYAPIAAVVFLAGIVVPVMTGGNLELKFEIMTGSADFSSDLLWCLGGEFWGQRLINLACIFTAAGSVMASIYLYAGRIFGKLLPFLICAPWRRLMQHGCFQVFPEAGASPEKACINLWVSLVWVLAGALAPLVASVYCVLLFLLGCVLHGMKLTLVIWIKERFMHWCFPFDVHYAPLDGDGGGEPIAGGEAIAVDATTFHIGNITEVVFETLPSFILNLINTYLLLRDKLATWQGQPLNWLSLICSCYMIFRQGYKYHHFFAIKRMSLNSLPIPGMENSEVSTALAVVSGTSAVVATGTTLARVTLQR